MRRVEPARDVPIRDQIVEMRQALAEREAELMGVEAQ